MKLIVVRHGETIDNVANVLTGQRPGVLTANGEEQVRLLGKRLRDHTIDLIISSDLARARQTTEALSCFHSCPVRFSKELREISYGDCEGSPVYTWRALRAESGLSHWDYKPPNGESKLEAEKRIRAFLHSLDFSRDITIVISAHSDVNRLIFKVLQNLDFDKCRSIPQGNTCVNIFEGTSLNSMSVVLQNDIEHLLPIQRPQLILTP